MAESKEKVKAILCEGPKNKRNGALFLRFERDDGRKSPLEILPGTILVVGRDVISAEAQKLLNNHTWKFSEVKNDG